MDRIGKFVFFCIAVLITPQLSFAKYDVAQNLLDAFSPVCPTVVTKDVRNSLNNINRLIDLFEKLKSDEECNVGQDQINFLNSYNKQYQDYIVYNDLKSDRIKLQESIARYTAFLSDPNLSQENRDYLNEKIFNAQTDLIGVDSEYVRFDTQVNEASRQATFVMQEMQSFLQASVGQHGCFNNFPNLAATIAGHTMMAVGPFLDPATRMAVSAGAVLTQAVGVAIHEIRFGRIFKSFDRIKMSTALQCLSEAMTNNYCEAKDTKELITEWVSMDKEEPKFEGLNLLQYNMDQLSHWLKEVHAGSEITSEGDLQNREKPILQMELLEKILRYTAVFKNIQLKDYELIKDVTQRSTAIAKGIESLVGVMAYPTLTPGGGSGSVVTGLITTNPIFEIYDPSLMPYQLYDPSITSIPKCGTQQNPYDCHSFTKYIQEKSITLAISNWTSAYENANTIVESVIDIVAQKRDQSVMIDPYRILVRANREFKEKTNALNALKLIDENAQRIIAYLTKISNEEADLIARGKYQEKILATQETGMLAQEILRLLIEGYEPREVPDEWYPQKCRIEEDPKKPNDGKEEFLRELALINPNKAKALKVTSCISKLLHLNDRGTDFFFQKIQDMVGHELDARLIRGEFEGEVQDIIYATKGDLIRAMQDTYNTRNSTLSLNAIFEGLDKSNIITVDTINRFWKVFDGHILKAIEMNNGSERARLCMRILPMVPDNSSAYSFLYKLNKLCQNTSVKGIWGDKFVLKFNDYITKVSGKKYRLNKPQDDIMCSYRRYQRDISIFEERRSSKSKLEELTTSIDDKML